MSLLYFIKRITLQVAALILKEIKLQLHNINFFAEEEKENIPDSNSMVRLFLLHIHESDNLQNRMLTQMYIQIATAP